MKTFLFLISFLVMNASWAGWPLVEREIESALATNSKLSKLQAEWAEKGLGEELEQNGILEKLQSGEIRAQVFIEILKKTNSLQSALHHCFNPFGCEKGALKEAVLYLRSIKEIDDTAGLILLAHVKNNKKQLNWLQHRKLDLPDYINTLKGIERSRTSLNAVLEGSSLTSRKRRVSVKPWGKISPRQELFLKYDLFEIKVLTGILEKTQKRITADSIAIIVDFDGDGSTDETIPVSPAERYRFAHKMLTLEVENETLSQGFLAGKAVAGPHLIMAASEMGLVNEQILNELIQMPELQNKKSEKGKMYLNALWSIGKAGLMAVPGGIYFVLPIVIVESYFSAQKEKEKKNAPTIF